jgi:LPXTG-motif cell wall-anchored protein
LQQRLAGGQTNATPPPPPPEATEKDNTIWYVLGGVAIIGILALVLTRSNKTA